MLKAFTRIKWYSLLLAAIMVILSGMSMSFIGPKEASAAVDYPYQEVMFVGDTGNNINIQGYADNSLINVWPTNGYSNERWRLSTTDGVNFKIINMTTNTLLSTSNWSMADGTSCVLFTDSNRSEQLWRFVGVDLDAYGDYKTYKIVNSTNTNMALTLNAGQGLVYISSYTGTANQKWKLNSSGIIGFAGDSKDPNGQSKAGTIGGLLGTTVFVTDYASFKSALIDPNPKTIVVAANIDCNAEPVITRVASNKTVIGSYAANTLTDPRLQTDDYTHVAGVGNNIIFKNLNIVVQNKPNIESIAIYGSRNVWIDHNTFTSTLNIDVNEVGKFVWANYSDYTATDVDNITISYNQFKHRYWCVAFGANSLTKDHATAAYNYFDSCIRRTPQLGNGQLHALNNYYQRTYPSLDDAPMAQIIGGSGSQVYSDANRFNNFKQVSSGYWDIELQGPNIIDVGSYTNKGVTPVSAPYLLPSPGGSGTTFNPSSKYSYKIIKAYDSVNGNDVRRFATNYTGVVSSYSQLKYIHYPDFYNY